MSSTKGVRRIHIAIPVAMVSQSKSSKGKKKSPRQQFLGAIMKHASGERGEELCETFAAGDTEKLRELLNDMVNAVVKKASRN